MRAGAILKGLLISKAMMGKSIWPILHADDRYIKERDFYRAGLRPEEGALPLA